MKAWILLRYYWFLARCARRYLTRHQAFTIGINGSVGKTSARMIIFQTLVKALPDQLIYTSPKNFNGELGMSLSIFQIEEWDPKFFSFLKVAFSCLWKSFFWSKKYDIILLEYGIDRPGEMEFLLKINRPHIGVATALDAVHSEQFWNPAAIAQEEVKMAKNTRELIFLNQDDHYTDQLRPHIEIDCFTYQTLGYASSADIAFSEEKISFDEKTGKVLTSFQLNIRDKSYKVTSNLIGKPNYGYIGVALMIADILVWKQSGKTFDTKKFLKEPLLFSLQEGRASLFLGKMGSILIDSTYNASPLSMRKLIDTTITLQKSLSPKRKILLVLGDMRELGDLTEKEHRSLAGYVLGAADQLALLGDAMNSYLADELIKIGFDPQYMTSFTTPYELADWILSHLEASDDQWLILFKGSQNTLFLEEAVKKLLLDPKEQKNLTRQSAWRSEKKEKYFASLS